MGAKAGRRSYRCSADASHHHDTADLPKKRDGVGHDREWWSIDNHEIVRILDTIQQIAHPMALKQFTGIRSPCPGNDNIESYRLACLVVSLFHVNRLNDVC